MVPQLFKHRRFAPRDEVLHYLRRRSFRWSPRALQVLCAFIVVFASFLAGCLEKPVSTSNRTEIVGSGAIGFQDGSAAEASFIEPLGLTTMGDSIIVADAGSQRIRQIAPDGSVTTLAGSGSLGQLGLSVAGGYADGPAAQSRFNHPAAIAAEADGSLIIADTRNHCLRLIRNGVVSTFAGSPTVNAAIDGPLRKAKFKAPRGLALAPDGALYVADYGAGLRKIDRHGNVTTLKMPIVGTMIVAVSVYDHGGDETVLASNGTQTVQQLGIGSRNWRLWSTNPEEHNDSGLSAELEGGIGSGYPSALAALGIDEFVYSDTQRDEVNYIHDQYTATLSVPNSLKEPSGITMLRDTSVAVADSGGRRVVLLPGPDRRFWHHPTPLPKAKERGTFRIAYVGNSYIYYNTTWSDSIPGVVESTLNADAGKIGLDRRVEVYPIRFGPFNGLAQYGREILASGLFDAVVLQLNSHFLYNSYPIDAWNPSVLSERDWKPAFTKELTTFVAALRKAHVPLAVVIHPVASEVGPDEAIYAFEINKGDGLSGADYGTSLSEIPAIVNSLGVHCVADSIGAFLSEEKAISHAPLFGAKDWHFEARGRHLVAASAAGLLEQCRPWATSP